MHTDEEPTHAIGRRYMFVSPNPHMRPVRPYIPGATPGTSEGRRSPHNGVRAAAHRAEESTEVEVLPIHQGAHRLPDEPEQPAQERFNWWRIGGYAILILVIGLFIAFCFMTIDNAIDIVS